MTNPDEAAARGLWSDPEFLANVTRPQSRGASTRSSPTSTATAGCSAPSSRQDRKGNLLDHDGNVVANVTPAKLPAAIAAPASARPS